MVSRLVYLAGFSGHNKKDDYVPASTYLKLRILLQVMHKRCNAETDRWIGGAGEYSLIVSRR
jgi:hypothetical protein